MAFSLLFVVIHVVFEAFFGKVPPLLLLSKRLPIPGRVRDYQAKWIAMAADAVLLDLCIIHGTPGILRCFINRRKRERIKVSIVIILALLCAFPLVGQVDSIPDTTQQIPEWGNIGIEGELSDDSIPQNDTIEFTVRLIIRGNPDDYAISDPDNPPVANLKLIGTSQANKTESGAQGIKLIKEYRYSFTPVSIGMAYINPLRIQYVYVPNGVSRKLASGRMEIQVTDPVLPEKPVKAWPFIIIGTVVALIIIGYFIWRNRSQRKLSETLEVIQTPEEIARKSIAEAKNSSGGNPEELISSLSRVFTVYVTNKYDIDARSLSDEKIIETLEMKGVPPVVLKNVGKSLDLADKVRFAAMNANSGDADMVELGIESLITYGEKRNRQEEENQEEK